MPRALVVAGVASGVGKTTVTLGLLAALARRGLRVQAFKVGPDYIDPGFHALVTGRPSYNLDGWMCGRAGVLETVARYAGDADVAVVEGVMGCFDGADATGEDGSTAQIAKWLGLPLVLVLDASSQSRSAAAIVRGFEDFDPKVDVVGVVANRVASAGHGAWVRDAIAASCRAAPFGALVRDDALALPERHLGLVTAAEGLLTPERVARLATQIEASLDLDKLLALARPLSAPRPTPPAPGAPRAPRVRIGVARDLAFQFYYAENLDRLRDAGAEIVFWSPLADAALPAVDGLYLGGGYPELHARALAANGPMREAMRRYIAARRPLYAECGGLMYLAEAIVDDAGVEHPMVGVLPAQVRMRPRRLTLGYTEVEVTAAAPIGAAGASARGHEFHFSTLDGVPSSVPRVYRLRQRGRDAGAEGYLVERALMSYVHLHFASAPELAGSFVEACAS